MDNFELYNPVRILFGRGKISEIDTHIPSKGKIMFCYGGGSIHKNGVYQQIVNALGEREYIEFGGIMPNPEYEFLLPAIEIVKKEKIDFLLAVGGGSVIDAVKFIAAAANFEGSDPWTILSESSSVKSAISIGVVLTLPATGTEMNGNSVITKKETHDKLAFSTPFVLPKFSILDPELTYSLPQNQVINGVIDAFIHVIEQYLTYPSDAPVQDAYAESLMNILKDEGQKAYTLEKPDYNNRASIMWSATNALNHFLSMGVKTDWSTHLLGHELTALHGLDHAVTLAIILPGVMEAMKEQRKEKLLQYAENVWGLTGIDHNSVIEESILKTEQFFKDLGVKVRLSDYDIGQETIERILERLNSRGLTYLSRCSDVHLDHVRDILESRL
ncbi:MAG: iron-containing alcohol dehydrogenase [Bacteroidales bacterium]|nr:iron-containing alcohol dehydrogenase [Bacteroidales bacterium]